jgi:hypothetical protein
MAAGNDLESLNGGYLGEPPRDSEGLAQLQREALQWFAHRLTRGGSLTA